jgi:hypothetical protein
MKRVELEMLSLLKTKNKENFLSLSKSLSHSSYECQTVEGGGGVEMEVKGAWSGVFIGRKVLRSRMI